MKAIHTFKPGDDVTIFQMSPSKGLFIEGLATVRKRVANVDEQYVVVFADERHETYERFIDREGQKNPEKYVREFNKRIGIKA
jgi:hypothetical protein